MVRKGCVLLLWSVESWVLVYMGGSAVQLPELLGLVWRNDDLLVCMDAAAHLVANHYRFLRDLRHQHVIFEVARQTLSGVDWLQLFLRELALHTDRHV